MGQTTLSRSWWAVVCAVSLSGILAGGCSVISDFAGFNVDPSSSPGVDGSVSPDAWLPPGDGGLPGDGGVTDGGEEAPCETWPNVCVDLAGDSMCQTSVCDPASPEADHYGCVSTPVEDGTSCEEVFACIEGESCMGGECSLETGVDTCAETEADSDHCRQSACADGNTCQEFFDHDMCEADGMICDPEVLWAGDTGCAHAADCSENEECRREGDPECVVPTCIEGLCFREPDDALCNDPNNLCQTGTCQMPSADGEEGGCATSVKVCRGSLDPCLRYQCQPATGECEPIHDTSRRAAQECEEQFVCSTGDYCRDGRCTAGTYHAYRCCDMQHCGAFDGCCPVNSTDCGYLLDRDCGGIIRPPTL
jgi:hypothetical protein